MRIGFLVGQASRPVSLLLLAIMAAAADKPTISDLRRLHENQSANLRTAVMTEGGESAAHAVLPTSRTHNFHYPIDGAVFGGRNDAPELGPYSYHKAGLRKGKLSEKVVHESKIYPGMKRFQS